MQTATFSPTPGIAQPTPIPVQKMTRAQLKDGLTVRVHDDVRNAPIRNLKDDLAAARIIQGAAHFIADTAKVAPSLSSVTINDRRANSMAAAGYAHFDGSGNGQFHLSPMTTSDLVKGVKHLRKEPLAKWSALDQQRFLAANHVLLHESSHITLPHYGPTNINAAIGHARTRPLEEGLTELASKGRLPEFIKRQYGQEMPPGTDDLMHPGSYTRWTSRLESLLRHSGRTTPDQIVDGAQLLGDATPARFRARNLARDIVRFNGPKNAPEWLTQRLEYQIPRVVDERPATGLTTMVSTLRDLRDGRPVDLADVKQRLAQLDVIGATADKKAGWPRWERLRHPAETTLGAVTAR